VAGLPSRSSEFSLQPAGDAGHAQCPMTSSLPCPAREPQSPIDFSFTYAPSPTDLQELVAFYHSLPEPVVKQYPGWWQTIHDTRRVCYFTARRQKKIVCYGQILEKRSRRLFNVAQIQHGPLFADPDTLVRSIEEIYRHYSAAGFAYLSVLLGFPTGALADYVEYALSGRIPVRHVFDDRNISTLVIDLSQAPEQILSGMAKRHQQSIRRAIREGLHVRRGTLHDMDAFSAIYTNMHLRRGHPVDADRDRLMLRDAVAFLQAEKLGSLMVVENASGKMLGGLILTFQGLTARCFKFAARREAGNLPIMHHTVFESALMCKELGFRAFDLSGYNHLVERTDQRRGINLFKRGFGGEFVFYPKVMHCYIGIRGWFFRQILKAGRNWI